MNITRSLTRSLHVGVLAIALICLPTVNVVKAQTTTQNYTALGDSLCFGLWTTPGNSYVSRYRDFLQIDNNATVNLDNRGVNGHTSADLLNALLTNQNMRNSVMNAHIVTWDIGGNDLLDARSSYKNLTCGGADNQNCLRAALTNFKSNWNAIIAQLLSLRANSSVLLRTMDMYNPYVNTDRNADSFPNDGGLNDFLAFKPYLDEINNYIRRTVYPRGIAYAKVYVAFNGASGTTDAGTQGLISFDGLHPNNTGHGLIANNFRSATLTRPARVQESFDFDSDAKSDLTVFRPDSGLWLTLNSSNNELTATTFGLSTDKLVPGDYDGDGTTDIAVWRPDNGAWYVLQSANGTLRVTQFGTGGDVPVPGDYDGDAKTDVAVFRPATGTWYALRSSNNSLLAQPFGLGSDTLAHGDYDGDGKTDPTVYRPSSGIWYTLQSSNGSMRSTPFGTSADRVAQGDYDGDGKTDVGVFRPANGSWYILLSTTNSLTAAQFGAGGDQPVSGDYDGDGKTDIAVFRPSVGGWYILQSSNGQVRGQQWGVSTDIPAR